MNVIGFVGSALGDEAHFVDYDPVVESISGSRFILTRGEKVPLSPSEEKYVAFFDNDFSASVTDNERLLFVGSSFLNTINILVKMNVPGFKEHAEIFELWFPFKEFKWSVGSWPVFASYNESISTKAAEAIRDGIDTNNITQVDNALKLFSICFVEDEKSKLALEIEGYEFLGDVYRANFMRTWLKLCCS